MTKIIMVRHGETEWNASSRYQGHTDIGLSRRGKMQALQLGACFQGKEVDVVYTSDLRRAADTAQVIAERCGAGLVIERGLRELDFGRWEGLTYEEIVASYPAEAEGWVSDPENTRTPGGEGLADLKARVISVIGRIVRGYPQGTVVIVSHGGVIRTLLCSVLGISLNDSWKFRIDNGSITVIDFYEDGGAIVSLLNDNCHIKYQNIEGEAGE